MNRRFHPILWDAAASAMRRLTGRFKSCPAIFAAMLREVFDESAYERFLIQRQLVSSRAAYAAFCREYETSKARRPRCC